VYVGYELQKLVTYGCTGFNFHHVILWTAQINMQQFGEKKQAGHCWTDTRVAYSHRNIASPYTAELEAILSFSKHMLIILLSSPYSPILICSDSLTTVLTISKPSSSYLFVARILTLITTFSTILIPIRGFQFAAQRKKVRPGLRSAPRTMIV